MVNARCARKVRARQNQTVTAPIRSVGTNPGARTSTLVYATGSVRRSRGTSLTSTQRNSEGRMSEWSMTPEFFTDPKWSATAYTNKAV